MGKSEGYHRLKEEMEERKRFAQEYEDRREHELAVVDISTPSSCVVASVPSKIPVKSQPKNPRVFLEVEIRGWELLGRPGNVEALGRLEFELFADTVPRTAENFRCLCTGEKGRGLSFMKSVFHRIVPGFMAQGGDITDDDGTGGCSIYGKTFADENFMLQHNERGVLSMANSGRDTNNSQFFLLFKPAPHLDRKHVVFGRLVREEAQLLKKIEEKGSKSGDMKGRVTVVACGEVGSKRARNECVKDARSRSRSHSRG